MKIKLSPVRSEKRLVLKKQADKLTINGEDYDFSSLPDGATLPRSAVECEFLASDVERVNGELELTLMLPHGANASQSTRFPADILNPPNGTVVLPKYDEEVEA